jgi:predicted outer membrane protein
MDITTLDLQTDRGLRNAKTEFDKFYSSLEDDKDKNYLRKKCRSLIDDLEDHDKENFQSKALKLVSYIKTNSQGL